MSDEHDKGTMVPKVTNDETDVKQDCRNEEKGKEEVMEDGGDDEDEKSVVEEEDKENNNNDDDDVDDEENFETPTEVYNDNPLIGSSSQEESQRSIIEWQQEDELEEEAESYQLGAQSQVPRSFFARYLFNETDVQFVNNTNKEVLFIIADEEFTIQRTDQYGINASISNNDGDDDDKNNDTTININFGLNLLPTASAGISANRSVSVTQQPLKPRCMPVAPKSNSTQHFRSERLTYVTALTKETNGEDEPWTKVHYENKVIDCQRTKELKFLKKHLKTHAYKIPPSTSAKLLGGSSYRQPSGSSRRSMRKITYGDHSSTMRRGSSRQKLMASSNTGGSSNGSSTSSSTSSSKRKLSDPPTTSSLMRYSSSNRKTKFS